MKAFAYKIQERLNQMIQNGETLPREYYAMRLVARRAVMSGKIISPEDMAQQVADIMKKG